MWNRRLIIKEHKFLSFPKTGGWVLSKPRRGCSWSELAVASGMWESINLQVLSWDHGWPDVFPPAPLLWPRWEERMLGNCCLQLCGAGASLTQQAVSVRHTPWCRMPLKFCDYLSLGNSDWYMLPPYSWSGYKPRKGAAEPVTFSFSSYLNGTKKGRHNHRDLFMSLLWSFA